MQQGLSILIPVYNEDCTAMVARLMELCRGIDGLKYEIIVADDKSTDNTMTATNRSINGLDGCRFIEKDTNGGAGATRNFLVKESKYDWLLFLDCDMLIANDNFIINYLECAERHPDAVINGGISIAACSNDGEMQGNDNGMRPNATETLRHNLRYLYESKAAPRHTAVERNKRPYQSFRSTNFMAPRRVMVECPFYEPMRRYEDVFFGKTLRQQGVKILHIDNPLVMHHFDSNETYINKVDKDMETLSQYRKELKGYSPLLTGVETLSHRIPLCMLRLWHRLFGGLIRRNLTGRRPHLKLLNVYKVGKFLTTKQHV